MADSEKTETSTPKHREDARKKGQVAKSSEVIAIGVLLTAFIFFKYEGAFLYGKIVVLIRSYFYQLSAPQLSYDSLVQMMQLFFLNFLFFLLPFLVVILLVALATNVLQVGFLISVESLTPKWERLNIINGVKRVFSQRTFVELIKTVLKIVIIGYVAYLTIKGEMFNILSMGSMDQAAFLSLFIALCLKLIFRILLVLLVVAILDFAYQKWAFEKSIRMSKQEIKDEMKQSEGDPFIKSRIRTLQREMARRRMMLDLPSADVVITNPTHLAVALKYKEGEMEAPIVLAKGSRLIAERIKEVAFTYRIPVIENKPLARSLYEQSEVGQQIPVTLYQTVASIIAYIYQLKQGRVSSVYNLDESSKLVVPNLS